LGIPLAGKTVLEVGAGIGDHSHFFKDRGCSITITEARSENLHHLKTRYPDNIVEFLDIEHPTPINGTPFDVVYCYGLLYHLKDPEKALEFLSRKPRKFYFSKHVSHSGKAITRTLLPKMKETLHKPFRGLETARQESGFLSGFRACSKTSMCRKRNQITKSFR